MTAVVAVINKEFETAFMAADSRLADDNGLYYNSLIPKIINRGNMLVGVCGSPALIQVLKEMSAAAFNVRSYEDILRIFLPELRSTFDKYRVVEEGGDEFNLLICAGLKIYVVYSNMQVDCIDEDFWAIGAGSDFCLGYLDCLLEPGNSEIKSPAALVGSIYSTARFCSAVGGPVKTACQKQAASSL